VLTTREKLHDLVDKLPNSELHAAERYLEFLFRSQKTLPQILAEAPIDDEPETPEEAAAVAEAWEDVRAGRVVSHDEVKRRLFEAR